MKYILRNIKQYKTPLLLSFIIVLSVWPFSFYIYPPKWDSIDCFLPFKYFWSNHVIEGHWPFWNPYQNLGYPAYSDLQSGLWSPISWLMVFLFGKYSAVSLSTEVTLYFLIAGLGVYKYSKIISENKSVRFFCGITFSLCGFMVGTTQIMVFIMGIAWLPWILHFTRRLYQTVKLKYILLLGLFLALEVTSASPAYTIILIYILLFLIGLYTWRTGGNKLKLFSYFVCSGIVVVFLTLPYIVSFLEFQPYFGRLGKLKYTSWIYEGSFDFAEYISFLFPISTLSKSEFWGATDLTLRNGYFGVFGLAFFIFGLIKTRHSYKTKLFFFVGIGFLILAAGDYTPFYKLAYYLPGFGTFRHPSFFRSYALLFFVLIAGIGFREYRLNKRNFNWIIFSLLCFSSVGLLFSWKNGISQIGNLTKDIFDYVEKPEYSTSAFMLLNSIILISLISLFLLASKRITKNPEIAVLIFVVLDLGIVSQITSPTTMSLPTQTTQDFNDFFNRIPLEINQEATSTALNQIKSRVQDFEPYPVWMNVATFTKRVSYTGANPTQMRSLNILENNGGLENIIQNPIFFTSKFIVDSASLALEPNTAWGTDIVNNQLQINKGIIGYNSFSVNFNNPIDKKGLLLLNQNYHALWRAEMNGRQCEIIAVNDGIMGVVIPGLLKGNVSFVFDSPTTRWMAYTSISGYLILAFLLLFKKRTS